MEIGPGYPFAQLAKAFAARDPRRIERWTDVLKGMASGKLTIGSRTPVKDMPEWVTPEVVRGGFATGKAAAAPGSETTFRRFVTEPGLRELDGLLTSGGYAVPLPEHAALLTVAWLVGAGEHAAAERLLDELVAWAPKLRFWPEPAAPDAMAPDIVWRRTADETRRALENKAPNPRVEAQREALAVSIPFTDELLAHWLETVVDGRVAEWFPEGWRARGRALLDRYDQLALVHKRTKKHWNPRKNPAILRLALLERVNGPLSPRRRGLLQHAVDSMRVPDPAVRAEQARIAALPSHADLARELARRIADEPPSRGLEHPDAFTEGAPRSLRRIVERGSAGTPEQLAERGIITSAEVLAELVPRIAAAAVSTAYEDERLATLMRKTYEAFRRRRSLLLLNLEHQIRITELPWVQAVAPHRGSADTRAAFTRLAALTLNAFPATLVPNPMIAELDALAREADLDLPLTEEIAADIFMGRFTQKYFRAAQLAGERLRDTLYARYYRLDYDGFSDVDSFGWYCLNRAPRTDSYVASNGRVIEQAQILTTHNLAALSAHVELDHAALIERAAKRALRLTHDRRKFAFAWRQIVFYASFTDVRPDVAGTALQPLFAGLDRGEEPFLGWR